MADGAGRKRPRQRPGWGPAQERELLAALQRRDFPAVIRSSVDKDGRSLQAIAAELSIELGWTVHPSALSSWQRGQSRPEHHKSLETLAALERILGYRRGVLTQLLPPKVARGRHRVTPPPGPAANSNSSARPVVPASMGAKRVDYDRLIAEIAEEAGYHPLQRHRTVQIDEFHRVGPDRAPHSHTTSQKLLAVEGMDRYHFVFDTEGNTEDWPRIGTTAGCRAGRHWRHDSGWCAVELLFDEWVEAGRTRILEYQTLFAYRQPPPPQLRRALLRGVEHLVVRVTFDPAALPVRVFHSRWPSATDAPEDLEPLRLDSGRAAHFIDPAPATGELVGIRWEWE